LQYFKRDRLHDCAAEGWDKPPMPFNPGLHFGGRLRPLRGFFDCNIGNRTAPGGDRGFQRNHFCTGVVSLQLAPSCP
jgi:hypothetical protein